MDKHEMALKTYEAIQKRKKKKEEQQALQHRIDLQGLGWNGYTKYMNDKNKRYYGNKHTIF